MSLPSNSPWQWTSIELVRSGWPLLPGQECLEDLSANELRLTPLPVVPPVAGRLFFFLFPLWSPRKVCGASPHHSNTASQTFEFLTFAVADLSCFLFLSIQTSNRAPARQLRLFNRTIATLFARHVPVALACDELERC